MFAMLTGTLPFTVEPFNIKQLHLKMVNGEISPIPSDISKGKVNTLSIDFSIDFIIFFDLIMFTRRPKTQPSQKHFCIYIYTHLLQFKIFLFLKCLLLFSKNAIN